MRGRNLAALAIAALLLIAGALATVTVHANARAEAAQAHARAVAADKLIRANQAAAAKQAAAQARAARGGTTSLQDPVGSGAVASHGAPVRLQIAALGVDTPLERLHRDSRGALLTPHYADEAGWFADGVTPGRVGPAVLVGHVDTIQGPAVFARLGTLKPGAKLVVRMVDGTRLTYRVDGSRVVHKALFPSQAIYGATPDAQLRIITCNEPFDPVSHTYTNNLVLFATLIA